MQLAESPILLPHNPWVFTIEEYLDYVYCVVSVVDWILFNFCVFDGAFKLHLEKVRSAKVTHVFGAGLDMIQEDLGWIERMAELTLTGHAVFETLMIHFHFDNLCTKLPIFSFLLTYGAR